MSYEMFLEPETALDELDGEFEFDEYETDGEAIDPEMEEELSRRGVVPRTSFRRTASRTPLRRRVPVNRRFFRRRGAGFQLSPGGEASSCNCNHSSGQASEYGRWLQSALNDAMSLQLPVSGVIDAATRGALRSFQQQQGLRADGIAGPETKKALVAARAGGVQSAVDPVAAPVEPAPAADLEAGFEFDSEFEFEDEYETAKARKPIDLGEIVVCGGKPFSVLDNFVFNKASLRKDSTRNHPAQVDAIAKEIRSRAAKRASVPSLCIVGHTDPVGTIDFNYRLGLERAKAVKAALCKALGPLAGSMSFVVNSLGETDPAHAGTSATANAGNRRVDVHLLKERVKGESCGSAGGGRKKLPPDSSTCGFPVAVARREFEFEFEEENQWEEEAGVKVQPKLCFYQEATNSSHRNHFHHQANGAAKRIGAIGSPDAANCKLKIGPTPYNTGADIIAAIRAAWQCTGKKPIQAVHIFGHSGSGGLYGTTSGSAGLYQNSYSILIDAASRTAGARTISDIPLDILADNVIFVLHGCNQAYGCANKGADDNFAQSLLEHLAGTLNNPKVYGHYNSGCAGRNNSWCRYSKTVPKGQAHVAPSYTEPGGCTPPAKSKEFEFEWEEETSSKAANQCDQVQHFRIDGYGRGLHTPNATQAQAITTIKSAIRKRARTCGSISMVVITGHASTEGDAGRNRDLGRRRAEAVKAALEPTFPRARIFVTSEGESKPLVRPDNSDAAQRQNRRVDIFLQ